MTLRATPLKGSAAEAQLYLREESMRQSFEAFLLASRRLHEVCRPLLEEYGLGAAHHRILFFVGSHEHITPTRLLERLGVTKQSLGRALNDLKQEGLLEQEKDAFDRRRKPLHLTSKGRDVEAKLFAQIREALSFSYRQVDGHGVESFRHVLRGIMQFGSYESST
ncbi:MarR family transcriptional regulator [Saccharibacter sp. 17.LH.SD]|uniref:MarR family winged helix-turn-helix transcriptional regulator n=1 Tax=Saccharibacter sp. 17.LH.SD TaxID=2689393 RepID=UPI0013689B93|nr:helix-turn-helix domain-containing protein [Saccharibacter sp. 17.LH.SD]MXV44631.1 MarR family transcriptional regulator [Saccharibacter sp. 17.LH.SD]